MTWLFSLPPSIIKKDQRYRHLHDYTVDWAYSTFKHVLALEADDDFWEDPVEFDLWNQRNFCYYFYDRVTYNRWSSPHRKWYQNGIGGYDKLFIVTNDDAGATMARLKWNEVNGDEYQH